MRITSGNHRCRAGGRLAWMLLASGTLAACGTSAPANPSFPIATTPPGTSLGAGGAEVAGAANAAGSSGARAVAPSPAGGPAPASGAGGVAAPSILSGGSGGVGGVQAGMSGSVAPMNVAGGAAPSTGGSGVVASPGCAASKLKSGDTTTTIDVHGQKREYILHVPAKYDGKTPVPLVIDWHPLLNNMTYQRANSGWANLSDREGFITLFPNGISEAWNIGNCCTPEAQMIDDLGLAKALVELMKSDACIDTNRVYTTGFSMGGGFTHVLGCKEADIFAAGAPSAFDLTAENAPCEPSRPITMIMIRGSGDPVVPFAGGKTMPPNGDPDPVTMLGAEATFAKWAELDGCTDQPKMLTLEGTGNNTCRGYSQCKEGVEVVLCVNPGGHMQGSAPLSWSVMKKYGLKGPLAGK